MTRKTKGLLTLFGHMSALALAYAIAGWIGLLLIDPALRGVVIWPAAGVASGVLISQGRRLWPGILVGFVALHWLVSQGLLPGVGPEMVKHLGFPAGIGAVLQALVAATLVKRRLGFPVSLATRRDIAALMVRAGLVACAVSATIVVCAAWQSGMVPATLVAASWFKWWAGDLAGVIIALPMALYCPTRPLNAVLWKGRAILLPNSVATAVGAIGLAASIFLSISITSANHLKNMGLFRLAVDRPEVALQLRLISLATGLEHAADFVSVTDGAAAVGWHSFVRDTAPKMLAGADGLGFIRPAAVGGIGAAHAVEEGNMPLVVAFYEALDLGSNMQGFNLGAVREVREAARSTRDSGEAEIAAWHSFADRGTQTMMYILLKAVYAPDKPIQTVKQRRAAFEGWVFMPLNAERAFNLSSQVITSPVASDVSIGAGSAKSAQASEMKTSLVSARFKTSRSFDFFQKHWVVTYHSTPWFEAATHNHEGRIVLAGGLALTVAFAALIMFLSERERMVRDQVAQRTEDLAIQNRKIQTIIDNAVVGILLVSAHGRIISANPASFEIFGRAADGLVGTNIKAILPEGLPLITGHLSEGVMSPTSYEKFRIVTPAGDVRWVELRMNSFFGELNEEIATLIVHDVTETVRAMDEVIFTERRWNLALEGSQIGVFDVDLETGHGVTSDAWRKLVGLSLDKNIDTEQEWSSRVHPEDLADVRRADEDVIAGRAERINVEYRFRVADGRWRWMRSDAKIVERDADGRALRLLGTMTDITPLKEALDSVKNREIELERLIASAPVAMTVLALDGTFLIANPAFGLFTGYPADSLIGRKLQDLPTAGELMENRDEIRQMLAGTRDFFNDEKHYFKPDGTEAFGLTSCTILRNNDGEAPRFICQILDITERKRLDQMRADFVATVSHELRTPLTSINGSLKLVLGLMSTDLPAKALHLLTVAQQNCDRLGRLVNDLLDMQKFASGQTTFEIERADVTQIVRKTLIDNASYAQKFSVRFKPLVSIAQVWSKIDVNRFQQVMANLLSNAAKFSPEGGEVITDVRRVDKTLVVSVTNKGRGISPEFREKIFTPFTQASDTSTRDREGSGLGLVISKEIVEGMGGEIGYESVPGASTTFWIKLPLAETEDAAPDLDGGEDAMGADAELRKENL